jgi:hypothetical protein
MHTKQRKPGVGQTATEGARGWGRASDGSESQSRDGAGSDEGRRRPKRALASAKGRVVTRVRDGITHSLRRGEVNGDDCCCCCCCCSKSKLDRTDAKYPEATKSAEDLREEAAAKSSV